MSSSHCHRLKETKRSLFLHITYSFSLGVKNFAVEGKSTITVGGGYKTKKKANDIHTKERENSGG